MNHHAAQSPGMSAAEAFHAELAHSSAAGDDPELLPDRLARACVTVLPVDGAGLSMMLVPDRRLPLGASDPTAAAAERLQFALGDGPCTAAHRERRLVVAVDEDLAARWPVYASQFATQTPYRMTLALPVGGPLTGSVVIDLYRYRPGRPAPGVLAAVGEVANACGTVLSTALAEESDVVLGLPAALRSLPVTARRQVWQAIGIVSAQRGVDASTALAVLRGFAFGQDADLETIAAGVMGGEVEVPRTLPD
ncbi:GAF domain-containing protein [Klenkia sp. PcliD-1-E]|uniref:GAF domain-containing protein n=1 Tax=Klenkia sp. PcliD-1-E TaxID=2954492 RepID=UPI0020977FD6|nr:GAF domain-containing protein [Klenkia sp. PcliD-1-E]MCO7218378.1 GAF domain-containing protein [Klenkia sp. PcliD-1-E]